MGASNFTHPEFYVKSIVFLRLSCVKCLLTLVNDFTNVVVHDFSNVGEILHVLKTGGFVFRTGDCGSVLNALL